MLFPDFDGFARYLYGESILYTELGASQYRERADREFQRGEYELAISDYDKAISLSNPLNMDPDNAYVYYERGLAKKELNRFEEAIADFQTAFPLAMEIADDNPELAPEIHNLLREIDSRNDKGNSEDE